MITRSTFNFPQSQGTRPSIDATRNTPALLPSSATKNATRPSISILNMDPKLPEPAQPTQSLTSLLSSLSPLAKIAASFFKPPDPEAQIRFRLLQIELAKALGGLQPYAMATWEQAAPTERSDHIILGTRGAGKTAFGCLMGEHLAKTLELPLRAIGFQRRVIEQRGYQPGRWGALQDCVCIVDEAGISLREERLWDQLALARHNEVSTILISQSTTALGRDALRFGATFWARHLDPLAIRFEREELVDLLSPICIIQEQLQSAQRKDICVRIGPPHVALATPLPSGWTEQQSRQHRSAPREGR